MNLLPDVSIKVVNKTQKIIKYVSLLILGTLIALRIAIVFSYVAEITGIDNNFVYTTLRLLAGLSPYTNPEQFPYLGNIYSPLFFQLNFLVGKLLGLNIESPIQIFWLCRFMSLLFDIGSIVILFWILAKRLKYPKELALLMCALFACILCYLPYTFSRVDSLFLFLYILTFNLLLKRSTGTRKSAILFIAITSVCCVFAKQNGIILLLLVPVWFYVSKQRRCIFPFLCFYLLCFTFLSFINVYVLGYHHLFDYTIKGIQNKIDLHWFYLFIFKPLASSLLIVPLGFCFAISIAFFIRSSKPLINAVSAVFVFQFVFSTGAAMKWGSSLGYYYECFFISMILILEQQRKYYTGNTFITKGFWYALPIICIFFISTFIQDYLFFISKQKDKKQVYNEQETVSNYLKVRLAHLHVLNLSEPNRAFYKLFLYKESAVPQFDTIDCCLLPDGNFNYSQLRQELQTGKIKYIIFTKGEIKKTLWGMSLEKYKKDTSLYNYDLYVHNFSPLDQILMKTTEN